MVVQDVTREETVHEELVEHKGNQCKIKKIIKEFKGLGIKEIRIFL